MAENFKNMRCRFQRLSDLKLFCGWIDAFQRPTCQIRTSGAGKFIRPGDTFRIEVASPDRKASFTATAKSISDGVVTMELESQVQFSGANETARVYVQPVRGEIVSTGVPIAVVVIDASEKGLGVILDHPIPKGDIVTVNIIHFGKNFTFEAEVRYCRKLQEDSTRFRAGLLIQSIGRIDRARFLDLLNDPIHSAA